MSIYFLKRYHEMVPAVVRVWHLGREIAFEAPGDAEAIAFADERYFTDIEPFGAMAILMDQNGRRIWTRAETRAEHGPGAGPSPV